MLGREPFDTFMSYHHEGSPQIFDKEVQDVCTSKQENVEEKEANRRHQI